MLPELRMRTKLTDKNVFPLDTITVHQSNPRETNKMFPLIQKKFLLFRYGLWVETQEYKTDCITS